jgi:hypothetical protein
MWSMISVFPRDRARWSRTDAAILVVWALALGLIVAAVSLNLRASTRLDTLHNLSAVLHGEPFKTGDTFRTDLPFYNRLLFPLVHHLLSRWLPFASENQWYLLLRITAFQGAFLAFGLACTFGLGTERSAAGFAMTLLAVATVVSFNFPWEEPSDALDLAMCALGTWAALRQRFLACLALSIVFAANRESATFLGVIWFALVMSRERWLRPAIEGGAICVLSYGTSYALKTALGPASRPNWVVPWANLERLAEAVLPFNLLGWLSMLAATLLLLVVCANPRLPQVRRFLVLAALLALPSLVYGLVNELRIFLPTFTMLCFAAAASVRLR